MFSAASLRLPNHRRLGFERMEPRALLTADGLGMSCLDAAGEPGDVVTTRLETTDLDGTPIAAIQRGREFLLHVFAEDTREVVEDRGVFSLYLDVVYDASLGQVSGPLQFHGEFTNGQLGSTASDGEIDDAGAFLKSFSDQTSEVLVFSVRMTAESQGTLNFTTNPADNSPLTEVLVFDSVSEVSSEDILFDSISLAVTWQGDIDLDRDVDFADFLAFSAHFGSSGHEVGQADINGDGEVSFADFLLLSQNFGRGIL